MRKEIVADEEENENDIRQKELESFIN